MIKLVVGVLPLTSNYVHTPDQYLNLSTLPITCENCKLYIMTLRIKLKGLINKVGKVLITL